MQDITNLVTQVEAHCKNSENAPTEVQAVQPKLSTDSARKFIDDLFYRFSRAWPAFGAKILDDGVAEDYREDFISEFRRLSIRPRDIEKGFERAKEKTWYPHPSAHEFAKCCLPTPEDYGLPDANSAYIEAANARRPVERQKYSHAIVYHAARLCGWFEIRTKTADQVFPRYKKIYEELAKKVINGEEFAPPSAPALEEKISAPLSSAEKHRRMKALMDEVKL